LNAQSTPAAPEELTYEQALELFDARLRALEEGNLSLEEAIAAVEEGRRYLKVCEAKLETARHKIEVRPEPGQAPEDALGGEGSDGIAETRLL
jgi:exodeoxyribonuclease VII small subunit